MVKIIFLNNNINVTCQHELVSRSQTTSCFYIGSGKWSGKQPIASYHFGMLLIAAELNNNGWLIGENDI